MNLRIVFKFKDCKLQFYEKRRLFSYFSVNPRTPAFRWRRLLKLFTPSLFLATKVAISFVYYSPQTIKSLKSKKKFTGIDRSSERASAIPHFIYLTVIKRILGMKWYDLRNLWNIFRDQFRLGDPTTPELMTFYTGNRSMSCLPLPKASSALSSPDSNSSRS